MKKKIIKKKKNKIHFFYSNLEKSFWKRLILRILSSHSFTFIFSLYFKTFISKIHIQKIVKQEKMNLRLFEKQKFTSYNDFFTRKYKKIGFCKEAEIFISPGEGFISIYPILPYSIYLIKNTKYHLSDFLKNNNLALNYNQGYIIVLRLAPTHYHRYIFVDNGIISHPSVKIKGKFHTVQPIAFNYYNVFHENSREYIILDTQNFGQIIQAEVGALLVGKINNHSIKNFHKGEEKGFFSIGGSTIILLVKPNKVKFEPYILKKTQENIETKVNIGNKIGTKIIY
ncbi:phosphatidylserine decarboxylase [Candidatus Phytoplasma phoenicium]|nr:phosphatidylserine decarboxylase [Candidatus Phytoplasma phoenicium]